MPVKAEGAQKKIFRTPMYPPYASYPKEGRFHGLYDARYRRVTLQTRTEHS